MMALWNALHPWQQFLTEGLLFFVMISMSGVILGRAGHNPYWAMLVIVPRGILVAIWVFAFVAWPKSDGRGKR